MSPTQVGDTNTSMMKEPAETEDTPTIMGPNKWLEAPKLKSSQISRGRKSVANGELKGIGGDGFITIGRDRKTGTNKPTSAAKAKSKAIRQATAAMKNIN